MKRVLKLAEPLQLTSYRVAVPQSTWEHMKEEPHFGGPAAYDACRIKTLENQGGICGYCEIDIRDNDPLKCRVEHFHPKSDITPTHNWALDWNNLLAVCAGGSYRHGTAPHTLEPLSNNLSCDAYKDRMIQSGKLPAACEGWILNPLILAAYPSFFQILKSTGYLVPNEKYCANHSEYANNQHTSLVLLVQNTIDMLNLNCDRLCQARLVVIRDIEHNKKKQRQQGYSAEDGLRNLASRYLEIHWHQFFTTIRICLGQAAENYLVQHSYQG